MLYTPTLAQYDAANDASWGRFKGISRPVLGNHEYGTSGARGYFDYFGARAGPRGSQVLHARTFGVLRLTLRPDSYAWRFEPEQWSTFTDSGTGSCR
jgi:hypothetical protein